jgi:hypothetical protein
MITNFTFDSYQHIFHSGVPSNLSPYFEYKYVSSRIDFLSLANYKHSINISQLSSFFLLLGDNTLPNILLNNNDIFNNINGNNLIILKNLAYNIELTNYNPGNLLLDMNQQFEIHFKKSVLEIFKQEAYINSLISRELEGGIGNFKLSYINNHERLFNYFFL